MLTYVGKNSPSSPIPAGSASGAFTTPNERKPASSGRKTVGPL